MDRLIYFAIPGFVLLLLVELLSYHLAQDDDLVGFERRDTMTSLSMGGGNLLINIGWTFVVAVMYQALYEIAPWHIPTDSVWPWLALFFIDDFAYYWFH